MIRSIQNRYLLYIICLFTAACSGTRHLPPGEKLYTGAEIILESSDHIKNSKKRSVISMEKNAVRPVPNKTILGMRPKLCFYMAAGEDPKHKFKKWLKKTGEPPVLMDNVKPAAISSVIDAALFNIGIFNSSTQFKILEKKHTSKVIYTSGIHEPYAVKELIYSISDDSVSKLILAEKGKSIIVPGEDYNLEKLKFERNRIDALLKNNGYFYFDPGYLLFKADTSSVNHTITFRLTLKDSIPKSALTVYRINNVYIDQDYSLRDVTDSTKGAFKPLNNNLQANETGMNIRQAVLVKSVYIKRHEIYSRLNHSITLNRLMSMGNFKFVSVKFSDSDTSASGYLDAHILLTPMPKHTLRAEIDLVSKSNNFTGPRVNISYLNKNTFRGAELLKLNLAGSYEAQLGGSGSNLYSYSFNPQAELSFPRLLIPFNIRSNSIYIPKTRFSLSYNYLKRVNYYDMRMFQFIYGFNWKEDIRLEYELYPINVSFTSIANKSELFTKLMNSNPYLEKSYEEQFIAGASYSFTYNEQVIPEKPLQFFLRFTSEVAGNAFSLAKKITGSKISSDTPSRIAGSIYSQFARLSIDGRAYFNNNSRNKLAVRVFAGVATPYGNSSTLPYIKQFFSGGPNSIRAFHINSVGPGTVHQTGDNNFLLQLGGDIKLEMNAEYRFNIYRFFKGALFTDAGNVWLLKSNPANTGSPFSFSGFSNELAVGAGVGLRVDISFVILRFDIAAPLRKPWLPENQRWVIDQINFSNSSWRKENLVLNLAIGYPF